ncbi:myristoylated alanine-rich C-kinase substrate-like [Suncus etruscus]|uniref:myristoylated alanine-rich C-kinase substrate-like n=1 Tax=Suncus etruscus TaxID=109475 RepID=UPI0021106933|nr:myristoylated alanine-rich C-kinase substrate-like [Suncus etruscus]
MRALVLLCCFVAWLLLPGQAGGNTQQWEVYGQLAKGSVQGSLTGSVDQHFSSSLQASEDGGGLSESHLSAGEASLEEKERALYAEVAPQDHSLHLHAPDGREAESPEQPPKGTPKASEPAATGPPVEPGEEDLGTTGGEGVLMAELGLGSSSGEEGVRLGPPAEEVKVAAESDSPPEDDTEGRGAHTEQESVMEEAPPETGDPDIPGIEQEPDRLGSVENEASAPKDTQDSKEEGVRKESPKEGQDKTSLKEGATSDRESEEGSKEGGKEGSEEGDEEGGKEGGKEEASGEPPKEAGDSPEKAVEPPKEAEAPPEETVVPQEASISSEEAEASPKEAVVPQEATEEVGAPHRAAESTSLDDTQAQLTSEEPSAEPQGDETGLAKAQEPREEPQVASLALRMRRM